MIGFIKEFKDIDGNTKDLILVYTMFNYYYNDHDANQRYQLDMSLGPSHQASLVLTNQMCH